MRPIQESGRFFSSSVLIHDWKKYEASDSSQNAQTPGIEPRISEAAIGHVWVADIPEGLGAFKVLYDGDRMLHRARSKGFMPEKRPNPDPSIRLSITKARKSATGRICKTSS